MLLGPQWISLPALPHPRLEACLLHLPNVGPGAAGTLFSISGASETTDDGTLNTTTALAMSPGGPLAWVAGPAPIVGRRDLACTLLPRTSTVVVIGGSKGTKGEDTEFDTLEMLDVSSGSLAGTSWTTADVKLSPGRSGAAAAATPDGSAVVIVGGFCCMGKYLDEALLFDGVTLTKLAPFPVARASLSLVTLSQHGALLAFGGGTYLYLATSEALPRALGYSAKLEDKSGGALKQHYAAVLASFILGADLCVQSKAWPDWPRSALSHHAAG